MNESSRIEEAARVLWENWQNHTRIAELSDNVRPKSRRDAYAVQAAIAARSGDAVRGWKIAATSEAGQRHIGVDGPLAGRLLAKTVGGPGAEFSVAGTHMLVAEAEFCFRMGEDLPSREEPYTQDQVLSAVSALYLAIEVPDSRFEEFASVGAEQLISDNACACWFAVADDPVENWRDVDLREHSVRLLKNGEEASQGRGANVLGDPRLALTWLVNEVAEFDGGVKAGELVTTGTCVPPVPIAAGDQLDADFGAFGGITVTLVD